MEQQRFRFHSAFRKLLHHDVKIVNLYRLSISLFYIGIRRIRRVEKKRREVAEATIKQIQTIK